MHFVENHLPFGTAVEKPSLFRSHNILDTMKLINIQVLFAISFILIFHRMVAEPSCTSFEYDKKILETIVRMEFDFKQMAEGIKITTQKVSDELVSLSEEKKKFITEITETQERQALDLSKKISAMDAVFTNQQATIQRLAEDLHVLKNETVKDIIGNLNFEFFIVLEK